MDLLYLEANPWNEDEERRYGNTRRLLNLANDLGYKFDRPEDAVQQQKVYESYASVKTLNLMAEITSTENKLDSINREISKLLMDKETRDITNMTKIESRLSKLASLSTHLTEAVEKKSLITSRLQKPYTGENLIIDASLHKCVVEFFNMVSPLLSDLPNLLDTVTWTSDNSNTLSSKSNQTLIRLSSQLDDINAQVAKLSKLREAVESVSKSYGK